MILLQSYTLHMQSNSHGIVILHNIDIAKQNAYISGMWEAL